MSRGEIFPQVDGATRYTWQTPRGTVAVDHGRDGRDGSLYADTCLGWRGTDAQRKRDLRAALTATRQALSEAES